MGVACVEEVDCCEKLFGTKNDVMEVVILCEVNMEQIIEEFDMMISSGEEFKVDLCPFLHSKEIPLEVKHQEIFIFEEHSSFVACLVVSLAFLIHATYFPFVSTRKLFSICHIACIFMVTISRFEFEFPNFIMTLFSLIYFRRDIFYGSARFTFLMSRGRRVT